MWSGDDACCRTAGDSSCFDIEEWLREFPATVPVAAAVARGAAISARDALRALRWDRMRFADDRDAIRWALTRGRQFALAEVMVMKPIRPLLDALAEGEPDDQEVYRLLQMSYVDRLPLADIGRVLGIAAAPQLTTSLAAARLRRAYERWHEHVSQTFGTGASGIAFPPPEQL